MQEVDQEIGSLEELHALIHRTLCESENLLLDQFETQRFPLITKGKICAIEFSLRGPRSLRLAAIWAADQNVIYFYNARGERHLKMKLKSWLDLSELEEAAAA